MKKFEVGKVYVTKDEGFGGTYIYKYKVVKKTAKTITLEGSFPYCDEGIKRFKLTNEPKGDAVYAPYKIFGHILSAWTF